MRPIVRLVVCLLDMGCPSAIRRLVVAIVVDPVDRVLRSRAFAHISQERSEGRSPLRTDGNTTSGVSSIKRLIFPFGIASLQHVLPDAVFSGSASAMRDERPRPGNTTPTTATRRDSARQTFGWRNLFVAAFALASPERHAVRSMTQLNDGEEMEALPGQIADCTQTMRGSQIRVVTRTAAKLVARQDGLVFPHLELVSAGITGARKLANRHGEPLSVRASRMSGARFRETARQPVNYSDSSPDGLYPIIPDLRGFRVNKEAA